MEQCLNSPNWYAMILDSESIRGAIAHAAELKLPRRVCRPLDRYRGTCANAALAKYDAEVDAAPLADERLDLIEAIVETEDRSVPENAGVADGDV